MFFFDSRESLLENLAVFKYKMEKKITQPFEKSFILKFTVIV